MRTKVISFISRKGGTGKTTIAINFAASASSMKKDIVLIETDTNYTLSTLRNIELEQNVKSKKAPFPILGADDESVIDTIKKIKEQSAHEYVVIDSAGKTTNEEIKLLALASDLIIIPTSLTKNDYLVTYQTVEDLKPALEHNPNLKIVVLPNRIHSLTKQENVTNSLQGLDAQILELKVPQKNIFSNFSTIHPEKEFLSVTKTILSHL